MRDAPVVLRLHVHRQARRIGGTRGERQQATGSRQCAPVASLRQHPFHLGVRRLQRRPCVELALEDEFQRRIDLLENARRWRGFVGTSVP